MISQPFRLRFSTEDGERDHVPDFMAHIRTGRWLIDVRPAARVGERDRVAFAASAEVALLHGWRYVVVSGWKPHVLTAVDTLSAQRRPLTDRLGLVEVLLTAAAEQPRLFGELAELTVAPPIARAGPDQPAPSRRPPKSIISIGQHTSPTRYIVDLRVICCLLTSSWPAARDLLTHTAAAAQAIDEHVRHTREQIDAIRRSGRTVREIAFYDRPPLDSATAAHLLAVAHQIISTADVATVRTMLRPLVSNAPSGMSLWTRQFLAGQRALLTRPPNRARSGSREPPRDEDTRHPPPNTDPTPATSPVRHQHIPQQHLLPEWHAEHLAQITDVKPHLVRRAAAARLAQLCVGGPATAAAELLGIPTTPARTRSPSSSRHCAALPAKPSTPPSTPSPNTSTPQPLASTTANDARHSKAWYISTEEWHTLIAGLPAQPRSGTIRPYIDWGDSKRLLASVWVCVRITHGEHIFAPAIRPNLNQSRPGGPIIRHIHTRWPLISARQPEGHYIALRQRLDAFADTLAVTIDDREIHW